MRRLHATVAAVLLLVLPGCIRTAGPGGEFVRAPDCKNPFSEPAQYKPMVFPWVFACKTGPLRAGAPFEFLFWLFTNNGTYRLTYQASPVLEIRAPFPAAILEETDHAQFRMVLEAASPGVYHLMLAVNESVPNQSRTPHSVDVNTWFDLRTASGYPCDVDPATDPNAKYCQENNSRTYP